MKKTAVKKRVVKKTAAKKTVVRKEAVKKIVKNPITWKRMEQIQKRLTSPGIFDSFLQVS